MPATSLEPELRPATPDDAPLVADLESLRDPTEPRDPVLLTHWWRMNDELERSMRRIAVREGAAVAYVGASHELWEGDEKRFGTVRPVLRYDLWDDSSFLGLVRIGEEWLRTEGAGTSVARVREDYKRELGALDRVGYREDRRMRMSELDLVANRERILASREECRRQMELQGVDLHPLSEDSDPQKFRKLHAMMIESEKDIPTTVPWRQLAFEEWRRFWFDNPAIRLDMFWVAREGDAIVGTSVLDCPVVRGVPWTAYTGTSRSVRGRGIARALKYESMGQAIDAGYTRVRTNNDADNPPILRINAEMGYRLVAPVIELHRSLGESAQPALRATSL
jgi:GNAT superfamily N-acetyltransferase